MAFNYGITSFCYLHVFFLYSQGPVVPQAIYQMVGEAIPVPLLGTESPTRVILGTG